MSVFLNPLRRWSSSSSGGATDASNDLSASPLRGARIVGGAVDKESAPAPSLSLGSGSSPPVTAPVSLQTIAWAAAAAATAATAARLSAIHLCSRRRSARHLRHGGQKEAESEDTINKDARRGGSLAAATNTPEEEEEAVATPPLKTSTARVARLLQAISYNESALLSGDGLPAGALGLPRFFGLLLAQRREWLSSAQSRKSGRGGRSDSASVDSRRSGGGAVREEEAEDENPLTAGADGSSLTNASVAITSESISSGIRAVPPPPAERRHSRRRSAAAKSASREARAATAEAVASGFQLPPELDNVAAADKTKRLAEPSFSTAAAAVAPPSLPEPFVRKSQMLPGQMPPSQASRLSGPRTAGSLSGSSAAPSNTAGTPHHNRAASNKGAESAVEVRSSSQSYGAFGYLRLLGSLRSQGGGSARQRDASTTTAAASVSRPATEAGSAKTAALQANASALLPAPAATVTAATSESEQGAAAAGAGAAESASFAHTRTSAQSVDAAGVTGSAAADLCCRSPPTTGINTTAAGLNAQQAQLQRDSAAVSQQKRRLQNQITHLVNATAVARSSAASTSHSQRRNSNNTDSGSAQRQPQRAPNRQADERLDSAAATAAPAALATPPSAALHTSNAPLSSGAAAHRNPASFDAHSHPQQQHYHHRGGSSVTDGAFTGPSSLASNANPLALRPVTASASAASAPSSSSVVSSAAPTAAHSSAASGGSTTSNTGTLASSTTGSGSSISSAALRRRTTIAEQLLLLEERRYQQYVQSLARREALRAGVVTGGGNSRESETAATRTATAADDVTNNASGGTSGYNNSNNNSNNKSHNEEEEEDTLQTRAPPSSGAVRLFVAANTAHSDDALCRTSRPVSHVWGTTEGEEAAATAAADENGGGSAESTPRHDHRTQRTASSRIRLPAADLPTPSCASRPRARRSNSVGSPVSARPPCGWTEAEQKQLALLRRAKEQQKQHRGADGAALEGVSDTRATPTDKPISPADVTFSPSAKGKSLSSNITTNAAANERLVNDRRTDDFMVRGGNGSSGYSHSMMSFAADTAGSARSNSSAASEKRDTQGEGSTQRAVSSAASVEGPTTHSDGETDSNKDSRGRRSADSPTMPPVPSATDKKKTRDGSSARVSVDHPLTPEGPTAAAAGAGARPTSSVANNNNSNNNNNNNNDNSNGAPVSKFCAPLPAIEPLHGPRLQGVAGRRGEMRIGAFLGGGACGKVYECLNTETGAVMAAKQLVYDVRDPKLRQRLKQLELELAVLTAARDFPFIVGFYGAEKRGHAVLMYLEYCERGSLLDFIAQGQSEDAATWVRDDGASASDDDDDEGEEELQVEGAESFSHRNHGLSCRRRRRCRRRSQRSAAGAVRGASAHSSEEHATHPGYGPLWVGAAAASGTPDLRPGLADPTASLAASAPLSCRHPQQRHPSRHRARVPDSFFFPPPPLPTPQSPSCAVSDNNSHMSSPRPEEPLGGGDSENGAPEAPRRRGKGTTLSSSAMSFRRRVLQEFVRQQQSQERQMAADAAAVRGSAAKNTGAATHSVVSTQDAPQSECSSNSSIVVNHETMLAGGGKATATAPSPTRHGDGDNENAFNSCERASATERSGENELPGKDSRCALDAPPQSPQKPLSRKRQRAAPQDHLEDNAAIQEEWWNALRPSMAPLSVEEVQRFAFQILLGLRFMHNRNYAHLDVKTANVLITANLNGDEAKHCQDRRCRQNLSQPRGGAAHGEAAGRSAQNYSRENEENEEEEEEDTEAAAEAGVENYYKQLLDDSGNAGADEGVRQLNDYYESHYHQRPLGQRGAPCTPGSKMGQSPPVGCPYSQSSSAAAASPCRHTTCEGADAVQVSNSGSRGWYTYRGRRLRYGRNLSLNCRLADLGCAMRLQLLPSAAAAGAAADSASVTATSTSEPQATNTGNDGANADSFSASYSSSTTTPDAATAPAAYPVLLEHASITELRGTALYMPPEMIRFEKDKIGSPADVWSFGCVVMEMATGAAPWRHLVCQEELAERRRHTRRSLNAKRRHKQQRKEERRDADDDGDAPGCFDHNEDSHSGHDVRGCGNSNSDSSRSSSDIDDESDGSADSSDSEGGGRKAGYDKLKVLFIIGAAREELPLPPLVSAWAAEAANWLRAHPIERVSMPGGDIGVAGGGAGESMGDMKPTRADSIPRSSATAAAAAAADIIVDESAENEEAAACTAGDTCPRVCAAAAATLLKKGAPQLEKEEEEYHFRERRRAALYAHLADFISQCVRIRPGDRATVAELLRHPFMNL